MTLLAYMESHLSFTRSHLCHYLTEQTSPIRIGVSCCETLTSMQKYKNKSPAFQLFQLSMTSSRSEMWWALLSLILENPPFDFVLLLLFLLLFWWWGWGCGSFQNTLLPNVLFCNIQILK